MARNLCRSTCCENTVRLEDLRGKPIEFRRYSKYAPQMGCRWDCPTCGVAYFVIWREEPYPTNQFGLYDYSAQRDDKEFVPRFTIDLSFYESYNDEHDEDFFEDGKPAYDRKPRHLCEDNAEDVQWVW